MTKYSEGLALMLSPHPSLPGRLSSRHRARKPHKQKLGPRSPWLQVLVGWLGSLTKAGRVLGEVRLPPGRNEGISHGYLLRHQNMAATDDHLKKE